jgi:hypothetical protein
LVGKQNAASCFVCWRHPDSGLLRRALSFTRRAAMTRTVRPTVLLP